MSKHALNKKEVVFQLFHCFVFVFYYSFFTYLHDATSVYLSRKFIFNTAHRPYRSEKLNLYFSNISQYLITP